MASQKFPGGVSAWQEGFSCWGHLRTLLAGNRFACLLFTFPSPSCIPWHVSLLGLPDKAQQPLFVLYVTDISMTVFCRRDSSVPKSRAMDLKLDGLWLLNLKKSLSPHVMPLIACYFNKMTLVLMNCIFFLKVEHAPRAEDQLWRSVWWGHREADGFNLRARPSGALTNYLCML